MKNILILLATLVLAACSSGGGSSNPNGGGGVVTEFGQKTAGEWLSDCTVSDDGAYKQLLLINANGTGETTETFYQNQTCTGAVRGKTDPIAFTYSVEPLADGAAKLTITQQGQQVQVTVSVLGNVMDVQGQNGKIRYIRIKQTQPPTPDQPQQDDLGGAAAFDALAKGVWRTVQCYPYQNNTSARQQLIINGRGSASTIIEIYQNQNCSGAARAERPQEANYQVVHFSNGQGQIMVKNETATVSIQGNRMTIVNANASTVFAKVQ